MTDRSPIRPVGPTTIRDHNARVIVSLALMLGIVAVILTFTMRAM